MTNTLTYKENYLLPTVGNKTGAVRRKRPNNKVFESNKLKVYPNPAKDYVIVEYQLAGNVDRAVVKVIDNNGFLRQLIEMENNHGYTVIDTRGLETDTYICHTGKIGHTDHPCMMQFDKYFKIIYMAEKQMVTNFNIQEIHGKANRS